MYTEQKRTDLALESAQTVNRSEGRLPEGVSQNTKNTDCFEITDIDINGETASTRLGKPVGRYITLEAKAPLDMRPQNFEQCVTELSKEISALKGDAKCILIAGLGNEDITPDSLGPRVCSHIFATRHIRENAPSLYSEGLGDVCAIAPGVMGQTGIEASEVIKSVCGTVNPDLVITVDALACSELSHLGKTVQLTDTGISPGSGVLNARKELSKKALGVRCVAIGVPTIADMNVKDPSGRTLMVTPRSVDRLISCSAQLISAAINLSVHPGLELEEIISLTS